MARLYKYADSSEKSGYFLLGSNYGQNTTIQVRPLGNELFEQLDYEAGRRGPNGYRGDRLPKDLVSWLWNTRLLYTESGEDSTDTSLDAVLDVDTEEVSFSTETIQQLVELIDENIDDRAVDLHRELIEILDSEVVDQLGLEIELADGSQSDREKPEKRTGGSTQDVDGSTGLSSAERSELAGLLSSAIDESTESVTVDDHLPRAKNPKKWLKSTRHFLQHSDAFVHSAAIGSNGDPVYNMETGDITWDLYDLRYTDSDDAAFLIIINPLSGHSPKQSIRLDENGVTEWQSYEEYLGMRQVEELMKVVPSIRRTLKSIPGFDLNSKLTFPSPSSRAIVNAKSLVNRSTIAAGEPFDIEPGRAKIWAEVTDLSPKGWVELRLQTNRSVVISMKEFHEGAPDIGDWARLKADPYSDYPTSFEVVAVD
jgi:hypothetical protein